MLCIAGFKSTHEIQFFDLPSEFYLTVLNNYDQVANYVYIGLGKVKALLNLLNQHVLWDYNRAVQG